MPTPRRRIRLYALSTCPACMKAKEVLGSMGLEFEVITVDALEGGEQWLTSKEVKKYNPEGTYPTLVIEEVLTDIDEAAVRGALGLS